MSGAPEFTPAARTKPLTARERWAASPTRLGFSRVWHAVWPTSAPREFTPPPRIPAGLTVEQLGEVVMRLPICMPIPQPENPLGPPKTALEPVERLYLLADGLLEVAKPDNLTHIFKLDRLRAAVGLAKRQQQTGRRAREKDYVEHLSEALVAAEEAWMAALARENWAIALEGLGRDKRFADEVVRRLVERNHVRRNDAQHMLVGDPKWSIVPQKRAWLAVLREVEKSVAPSPLHSWPVLLEQQMLAAQLDHILKDMDSRASAEHYEAAPHRHVGELDAETLRTIREKNHTAAHSLGGERHLRQPAMSARMAARYGFQ